MGEAVASVAFLEEAGEGVVEKHFHSFLARGAPVEVSGGFRVEFAGAACDRLRWVDLVEDFAHWKNLVSHLEHEFLFGEV